MTAMHILHISTPKSWRGGEQQVAYLMEELRTLGIQQSLLCPIDSKMRAYAEANNFNPFSFKKIFSLNPFVAQKIKKICLRDKIDIVHVHDSHGHSFAWLAALLFQNKTPIVVSRRVDFPIKNKKTSLWKYNHSNIQSIICVSKAVKAVISPAIENKQKLTVVYDGIDLKRFPFSPSDRLRKEFNISKEKKLIGNIAAIAPHKDYFTFVDTVAFLQKQNFLAHYFIIGADGGEKEQIEKYIQKKELSSHITLTGFRKDIPSILPELDVFLFTSKTEGLGTAVLDALLCGVPVVATQAGGIPEYIKHKKNGLLAPVQNFKKLAENILFLQNNASSRLQLITEAQKTVQSFSKSQMAKNTLKIYNYILK